MTHMLLTTTHALIAYMNSAILRRLMVQVSVNGLHKYKKLKSCTYFCLHSCTKGSWAWTLSKTTLTFTASQSITWNETGQNYLLVGAWLSSGDHGWSRVKNTETRLSISTKLLVGKVYSKLNSTRRVTVKTCKKQYKVNLSFVEV